MAKQNAKNTANVKRKIKNLSNVHKTLNLDNCVEKTNFRKVLQLYIFTEFSGIIINDF